MQFQIHSTGLYSTWIYYPACGTLFDCGEGAASSLGKRIFGVDRICLTHGHTDHIAGLPTFINARNRSVGDPFRPLTIYYPEGDRYIVAMAEFIRKTQGNRLRYPLNWEAINPGDTVRLGENSRQSIETFRTMHNARLLSFGYRWVETRKRLKEAYRGRADIGTILRDTPPSEKERYEETYDSRIWTYTGDMKSCEIDDIRDSEVLVTDATFLDARDRAEEKERQSHMTMDEAVELAAAARVGHLYAIHLSERYHRDRIDGKAEEMRALHPGMTITVVYPRRTYTVK